MPKTNLIAVMCVVSCLLAIRAAGAAQGAAPIAIYDLAALPDGQFEAWSGPADEGGVKCRKALAGKTCIARIKAWWKDGDLRPAEGRQVRPGGEVQGCAGQAGEVPHFQRHRLELWLLGNPSVRRRQRRTVEDGRHSRAVGHGGPAGQLSGQCPQHARDDGVCDFGRRGPARGFGDSSQSRARGRGAFLRRVPGAHRRRTGGCAGQDPDARGEESAGRQRADGGLPMGADVPAVPELRGRGRRDGQAREGADVPGRA